VIHGLGAAGGIFDSALGVGFIGEISPSPISYTPTLVDDQMALR
jgi:hypothetical protein